jgi:hypothetical protein
MQQFNKIEMNSESKGLQRSRLFNNTNSKSRANTESRITQINNENKNNNIMMR